MDMQKLRTGVKWGRHKLRKIQLYSSPQTEITGFLPDYKLGLNAWLGKDVSPLDHTTWVTS